MGPARVREGCERPPGQRSLSLSQHFTRLPCLPPPSQPMPGLWPASSPRPAPPALPLAHPLAPSAILPLIFRLAPIFMSMFTISNLPCTNRETSHTNQSHVCHTCAPRSSAGKAHSPASSHPNLAPGPPFPVPT